MDSTTFEEHFKFTPFIVTLCDPTITVIDIQNLLELGIRIVRFKITHNTEEDLIYLINLINDSIQLCCEKYNIEYWPIAIGIDIPNCIIKSGIIKQDLTCDSLTINKDTFVTITCDRFYLDKCDDKIIFIDDPYIINDLKVGTEISFGFGKIIMFCVNKINDKNILCSVQKSGSLGNVETVCVRGIIHKKPILNKRDLKLIEFSKTANVQIIIINSVRHAASLERFKKLLGSNHSNILIFSSICEQEGLDDIDGIIEESDGIILSRDFLANELLNANKMLIIQKLVSAKCRQMGKPFYISGSVFEEGLMTGEVLPAEVSDVTNAVLLNAGLVLKDYKDSKFLLESIATLNSICRFVEPLCPQNDFWRLSLEFPAPVNAADACILACALTAHKLKASLIILPTVSGHTVAQLVRLAPTAIIVSVSTELLVSKKLQIYRGVVPLVYKAKRKGFYREMEARIAFALEYSLKHNFLKHGQVYITLLRSSTTSSYCDMVRFNQAQE